MALKYCWCLLQIFVLSFVLWEVKCEIIPRFDMRDKDGIIFDPIVPRAGEKMTAKCTVVQLTPENRKSVSWRLERRNDGKVFYLATNNDVFQFKNPIQRLWAIHELNSHDWFLVFNPLDRDDIGNLTCFLADTGGEEVSLTRFLDVHSKNKSLKNIQLIISFQFIY
jgi:hypothetical protein